MKLWFLGKFCLNSQLELRNSQPTNSRPSRPSLSKKSNLKLFDSKSKSARCERDLVYIYIHFGPLVLLHLLILSTAKIHEDNEEFLEAAKILVGIPLDGANRYWPHILLFSV